MGPWLHTPRLRPRRIIEALGVLACLLAASVVW